MAREKKKYNVFYLVTNGSGSDRLKPLTTMDCKVTCFSRPEQCFKQLEKARYHLMVIDIAVPGIEGLMYLRHARRTSPWVPVVIVANCGDIGTSVMAMKMGAVDYFERSLDRGTLCHRLIAVLKQVEFENTDAGQLLTPMETIVLKLILQGMSNSEIAYRLGRAVRTVEMHRANIMRKFQAHSVVDLVKKCVGTVRQDVMSGNAV